MAVWQSATDSYWEFFKMQQALHGPQFARFPSISTGCALPEGNYFYRVTSVNQYGETRADATAMSADVASDGGCVTIRWAPVHGATDYRVYRGPSNLEVSYLASVSATPCACFTDEGSTVPNGMPPPAGDTAQTPGEWHAAYGGFMAEVSKSPGYYRTLFDSTGGVLEQANWGSAATALPLAGGLITKEDIARGSIDHALSIGLDNSGADAILRAGQFAFPAQRSDGRSEAPDSIPEGARLVLDPDLEIGSLGLPPFVEMLAEAAQKYGMIVHDGSAATVIYAEDPAPYVREGQPNFYRPLVGSNSLQTLRAFPWQDLELARMRLCTSRPCTPA
jgi:hypothetical protein